MKTLKKVENRKLTSKQEMTLIALAAGANLTEAASAAGVTRESVSAWYNHNNVFQSALAQKREAVWQENLSRLRGLLSKAIDQLDELLSADDPALSLKAVATLLRTIVPGQLNVAHLGKAHIVLTWGDEDERIEN